MTETEYAEKLEELDRLLNDPDAPIRPDLVWSLLAEIAEQDLGPNADGASASPQAGYTPPA